jgi:hypothetical protein
MRVSALVVVSFAGMICLAAFLLLFPKTAESPVGETGTASESIASMPEIEHSVQVPGVVSSDDSLPENSPLPATSAEASMPDETPVAATPDSPESTTPVSKTVESAAVESTPAPSRPAKDPTFLTWPKPQLALVITGEQHGYFEPCGCTANQLGGMSRRGDLFAKLEGLGWTVRGLDVGGLSRRTGPQAQLKFETTLAALRQLKYVSLALGPEELQLDPGYLLSQHLTDGETPLQFLGANLVFFGSKDLGTPLDSTILHFDGLKVGITSVMSDTIRKQVIPDRTPDEAAAADLQWTDPEAALKDVLTKFDNEQVNFRILLSQSTDEEIQKQAAEFPQFDIIVAADGKDGDQVPEMLGNTRMLRVGEKGKTAGVVGIYPNDPENPVRYELVTISAEHFGETKSMIELMAGYQTQLKDTAIVKSDRAVPHPSGASFVGAGKCAECHTKAFEIWKNTPHAHALESLDPVHQRTGHERLNGILRSFDPECLSCHVTGWDPQEYIRFQSGFIHATFADEASEKGLEELLAGNQCENCHGPGSRHIELIELDQTEEAGKHVRLTLENAERSCTTCHDADNSPEFNFQKYWDQVKHYGKD